MTKRATIAVALLVLGLAGAEASAEGAPPPAQEPTQVAAAGQSYAQALAKMGACIGAAICAAGGGYAISRIGSTCIEATARQPEAAPSMFGPMVVSAAMVEGGMLFAIVVCLLVAL